MIRDLQLAEVNRLENAAEALRQEIGVAKRGENLFHAPQSMWSENDVAVEADGVGGAKLLIVCGNYPIDYSIKREVVFDSEDAAYEAAEKLISR